MSEPDVGSDVAALRTTAVDDGDHFVVNGQKAWCTGAGLPGTVIAMYVRTQPDAPKHDGLSLVLVDPGTPGVEIRRTPTLARHILGTNEVFLRDVRVPKANLVGPLNGGWQVLLSGLDVEKILMSAAYVGTAQATLDEALDYAKLRTAFGRPIGNFQAISHALADLQTDIDAARLLVVPRRLAAARTGALHPRGSHGQAQGIRNLRRGCPLGHANPGRTRVFDGECDELPLAREHRCHDLRRHQPDPAERYRPQHGPALLLKAL